MRNLLFAAVMVGFFCSALAAESQQNRMKDCNADATRQALKGDARKQFMRDCLATRKDASGDQKAVESAPPLARKANAQASQQQRLKNCNADAKARALKGDIRRQFMKDCLSGK